VDGFGKGVNAFRRTKWRGQSAGCDASHQARDSRFLDGRWAARAAALGWGPPLHLFGCDRKRPFARLGGLLWELNGGKLIDLRRDRAIIEIKGGARLYYRRRSLEVGRAVLAWELE
jgi:hypothetical protein